MEKGYNVTVDELKYYCNPNIFDFESTAELEPFEDGIIGQKRAVDAIDMGMRIDQDGYNIYISGVAGSGRSTYAKTIANKKAEKKDVPHDVCYVFNFDNHEKTRAMKLPPGTGILTISLIKYQGLRTISRIIFPIVISSRSLEKGSTVARS